MRTRVDDFELLRDRARLDMWAKPKVRADRPALLPVKTALGACPDGAPCLYHTHDPNWRPAEQPDCAPLADFIKLHDLPRRPERAQAFAERYGLLNTCGHERPEDHEARSRGAFRWWRGWECEECNNRRREHWDGHTADAWSRAECWCLSADETGVCPSCEDVAFHEPLAVWAATAAHFRAGLRIAACLRVDEPVRLADYHTLWWGDRADNDMYDELRLRHREHWQRSTRRALEQIASAWLNDHRPHVIEGFGLSLSLGDEYWPAGVHFQPMGLLANLSLQFAAALSSTRGLYICDECGNPFQPQQRAPWQNGGRRALCPDCRRSPKRKAREQRERYARLHPTQQRSSRYRTNDARE